MEIELDEKPQRTKKKVIPANSREQFLVLIESGIPLKMATFHRAVRSWTGEPETAFYASGAKPSRTAKMWYTPHGMAWEHNEATMGIVPLANVSDTRVL